MSRQQFQGSRGDAMRPGLPLKYCSSDSSGSISSRRERSLVDRRRPQKMELSVCYNPKTCKVVFVEAPVQFVQVMRELFSLSLEEFLLLYTLDAAGNLPAPSHSGGRSLSSASSQNGNPGSTAGSPGFSAATLASLAAKADLAPPFLKLMSKLSSTSRTHQLLAKLSPDLQVSLDIWPRPDGSPHRTHLPGGFSPVSRGGKGRHRSTSSHTSFGNARIRSPPSTVSNASSRRQPKSPHALQAVAPANHLALPTRSPQTRPLQSQTSVNKGLLSPGLSSPARSSPGQLSPPYIEVPPESRPLVEPSLIPPMARFCRRFRFCPERQGCATCVFEDQPDGSCLVCKHWLRRATCASERPKPVCFLPAFGGQMELDTLCPVYRCTEKDCCTFSNSRGAPCQVCGLGTLSMNCTILDGNGDAKVLYHRDFTLSGHWEGDRTLVYCRGAPFLAPRNHLERGMKMPWQENRGATVNMSVVEQVLTPSFPIYSCTWCAYFSHSANDQCPMCKRGKSSLLLTLVTGDEERPPKPVWHPVIGAFPAPSKPNGTLPDAQSVGEVEENPLVAAGLHGSRVESGVGSGEMEARTEDYQSHVVGREDVEAAGLTGGVEPGEEEDDELDELGLDHDVELWVDEPLYSVTLMRANDRLVMITDALDLHNQVSAAVTMSIFREQKINFDEVKTEMMTLTREEMLTIASLGMCPGYATVFSDALAGRLSPGVSGSKEGTGGQS